jgi:hypothetical protein
LFVQRLISLLEALLNLLNLRLLIIRQVEFATERPERSGASSAFKPTWTNGRARSPASGAWKPSGGGGPPWNPSGGRGARGCCDQAATAPTNRTAAATAESAILFPINIHVHSP